MTVSTLGSDSGHEARPPPPLIPFFILGLTTDVSFVVERDGFFLFFYDFLPKNISNLLFIETSSAWSFAFDSCNFAFNSFNPAIVLFNETMVSFSEAIVSFSESIVAR